MFLSLKPFGMNVCIYFSCNNTQTHTHTHTHTHTRTYTFPAGFLRKLGHADILYKSVQPGIKGATEVQFYDSLFGSSDLPSEVVRLRQLVPNYYKREVIKDRAGNLRILSYTHLIYTHVPTTPLVIQVSPCCDCCVGCVDFTIFFPFLSVSLACYVYLHTLSYILNDVFINTMYVAS